MSAFCLSPSVQSCIVYVRPPKAIAIAKIAQTFLCSILPCKIPIYLFQIHLSHRLNLRNHLFGDISALQIPVALNVLLLLLSSL